MIDARSTFSGGLNLDDSLYHVASNSYIDALNATRDAIEGSNDISITNIVGNQLVDYSFPSGIKTNITQTVVGNTTQIQIEFVGLPYLNPDFGVSISMFDIPAGQNLIIGNYLSYGQISLDALASQLAASITTNAYPGITAISSTNNILSFTFASDPLSTPAYSFDAVNIIPVMVAMQPINRYKCIGSYANQERNTIVYFIWNLYGVHLVLEYDNATRTISPIFENLIDSDNIDILGFDENKKINSINIINRNESIGEGDLLFFLDGLGRPTTMDISRFKAKHYVPVTRSIINVIKNPPLLQPHCSYSNDTNKNANSLINRFFRFKYRYVYDNNERSVCSPISDMPIPVHLLDDDYNRYLYNNNVIPVSYTAGDKSVKAVELLMSYSHNSNDWSDFYLINTDNIDDLSINYGGVSYFSVSPVLMQATVNLTVNNGVVPGTVINVYLSTIPAGIKTLIGSYTTVIGDDLASVNLALSNAINAAAIPNVSAGVLGQLFILYNVDQTAQPAYAFDSVEIIKTRPEFISLSYKFYNDSTYPLIDVNESIQLYDYVPDIANAQETPNGNVLLYGGITEGYDKDLIPNVVNTISTRTSGSAVQGNLSSTWSWTAEYIRTSLLTGYRVTNNFINLSGVPLTGTVVNVYIYDKGLTPNTYLAATYTTVNGDTALSVASHLVGLLNAGVSQIVNPPGTSILSYTSNLTFRILSQLNPTDKYVRYVDHVEIIEPIPLKETTKTFLFSTQRKLGMAYFDKAGKTNGILYSDNIVFPPYAEDNITNEVLLPYINTKVYHQPPEWAHSFGFYLTKENTQFIYWEATSLLSDTNYVYLDVSNFKINQEKLPTTTNVLSYAFQEGDRVRVIKNLAVGTYYPDNHDIKIEGQVTDPGGTIPNGTYIKIKKLFPFSSLTNAHYIIQLYRPSQYITSTNTEVYYEFGQNYLVGNPGTSSRYHTGSLVNQGNQPDLSVVNSIDSTYHPVILGHLVSTFNGSTAGNVDGIYVNLRLYTHLGIPFDFSYTSQTGDTISNIIDGLINNITTSPSGAGITPTRVGDNVLDIVYIKATWAQPSLNYITIRLPNRSGTPAEYDFFGGDVYFRERNIYIDASTTDTFNCVDRNIIDTSISGVNNINGRPSVIDDNARKAYYSAMVRFSQAYQPNTNINGTNRFYSLNFDEYDYSYGDIMRFTVRDRFVRVFQKLKVGQVPLYHQILKEQDKESLVVSDKLLNPIQYYIGDVGIGDNPESLASYRFADYFTSNIKGVICRVSNDGIVFLSVNYKVDSWSAVNLPLRTGNYKTYGTFDPILGNYIVALEATNDDSAHTILFDEKNQTFETFLSIAEVSSTIWDTPVIQTDLDSYAGTKMQTNLIPSDFAQLEGSYEATILRDANSIGGILDGDTMKGKYLTVKFRALQPTSLVSLNLVSLKYIDSPLNVR